MKGNWRDSGIQELDLFFYDSPSLWDSESELLRDLRKRQFVEFVTISMTQHYALSVTWSSVPSEPKIGVDKNKSSKKRH